MYDKFGQYINGKWQKSSNEETYAVLNPATEETLGMASKASSNKSSCSFAAFAKACCSLALA